MVPVTEEGAGEAHSHRPNQQAHGTVSRRRSKVPAWQEQHWGREVGGGRGTARLPQGCFPRDGTGQPGLCPSHCRSPHYVPAGTSRVVRRGQKKRDRERPAHPSTEAALACYGQGLKCIETKAKAESEDLREEGTVGEPQPAPSRGIAPKKGHLSCTEKERRNKRKRKGVSGSSAGGIDKQAENQGGGVWAAV